MAANELAKAAGLSNGMLLKIERNDDVFLQHAASIAAALKVPLARLSASHEQRADYSLVRAGKDISVRRRGSKLGLEYELLDHLLCGKICRALPRHTQQRFQCQPRVSTYRIAFMYVLEGSMLYRHADALVELRPGDPWF